MQKLGFTSGRANPCVFRHSGRDLVVSVHVDDFLCLGDDSGLRWLRTQLQREFDCTSLILGEGENEGRLVDLLGQTIVLIQVPGQGRGETKEKPSVQF